MTLINTCFVRFLGVNRMPAWTKFDSELLIEFKIRLKLSLLTMPYTADTPKHIFFYFNTVKTSFTLGSFNPFNTKNKVQTQSFTLAFNFNA